MKIEWVEEKFPDLAGETGAFTRAAGKKDKNAAANVPANVNAPKNTPVKLVPKMRTCHGDLVPAPSAALGM